jgi:hypothetical protein
LVKTAQAANKMNWPRKVFLESTALFQLGSRLQTLEFAKLLDRQEHLKFDLLVSEVSWAEYTRQRKDKITSLATDIDSIGRRLREWGQNIEKIVATHSELGQLLSDLDTLNEKKAREAKI